MLYTPKSRTSKAFFLGPNNARTLVMVRNHGAIDSVMLADDGEAQSSIRIPHGYAGEFLEPYADDLIGLDFLLGNGEGERKRSIVSRQRGKGGGKRAFRPAGHNSGSLRHKVSGNNRLAMKGEGCAARAMQPPLVSPGRWQQGSGDNTASLHAQRA